MSETRGGERTVFLLLGAAAGAAVALLTAPSSGARTRRRFARKSEAAADYLMHAGKDLVDKCEDLYERSSELVGDTRRELSGKYRALQEYSKHTLDEAEAILRRTKIASAAR